MQVGMESGVEAGSGGVCNAFLLPTALHCARGLWGSVLSTLPPKLCARPATPPQVVATSPADLREKIHGSVTTVGPGDRISHHPNHHPFIEIRVRSNRVWPSEP